MLHTIEAENPLTFFENDHLEQARLNLIDDLEIQLQAAMATSVPKDRSDTILH